jgi:nucleotidyltransferase substrate binding protein (TIGR01987 family)
MNDKNFQDIRWKQRLKNFSTALNNLREAVNLSQKRELSNLEKQGLIQSFEFTHELAWKIMKDYFDFQGGNLITGSRDATREAFNNSLISQGDLWMEMIKSRNQTSHTYNENVANEIVKKIVKEYFNLFQQFFKTMVKISKK